MEPGEEGRLRHKRQAGGQTDRRAIILDEGKNEFYGRPTYVLQMPDGALLVSDEQNGATYRISYEASKTADAQKGKK